VSTTFRLIAPALWVLALSACTGPTNPTGNADSDDPTPGESTSTERILLHEMFTGSNCGPCFEADANLMEVLDARPERFTLLAYQVGSDPYMSNESVRRRLYYLPGESSYAIPYLHVDGHQHLHPTLGNNELGYTTDLFDEFAAPSSPIELAVSHSLVDQTLSFQITLHALDDIPSEQLLLHAAIIEGVTYNNVGINDQTEFHHVMKKMVPDHHGTPIGPFLKNDALELDLSWTFEGDYVTGTGPTNMVDHSVEHTVEEFEDLSVIVWVQDEQTWEVYQSAASATDSH
jgi:hypothetical protein